MYGKSTSPIDPVGLDIQLVIPEGPFHVWHSFGVLRQVIEKISTFGGPKNDG